MTRFSILLAILMLPAGFSAYSQDNTKVLPDTLLLNKATVTSLKIGRDIKEAPSCMQVVSSEDVNQSSSFSVADVLKDKPGLSKGGDGIWATNLNLRGLGENRLVTLIDNNRVETATDLTVSLSMIDIADIERVEVIHGAQSSIYGSGAMGGIINVITKDGHFSDSPYFNGNVSAKYSSVNNSHEEYLSLYGGGKRWYVKANASFSGASDAATPLGYLPNSGYKTCNGALAAAFKPVVNHTLKAQFQLNHSWDVGIPGGAAFSPQATASYRNIDRTMASLAYEIENVSRELERLCFKVWYQGILRDVEMIPNSPKPQTGAMPMRVTPYASHITFGANAESTLRFVDWNTLTLGAEMWRRGISSNRNKYIDQYTDGVLSSQLVRNEHPLPDASHLSAGIFAQNEMRLLDNSLILSFGGRFDINVINNAECHNVESVTNVTTGKVNPNPPGKFITFTAGNRVEPSWSANAGLLFKAARKCDLVLNVSRSYRSPSLEELFKFIDLSGNRIHFGNPSLKAEKGIGGDIGVRFHGDRLNFRISVFANGIRDMIVERCVNTNPSSVNDTLVLDNASRAFLYGFDADISYEIVKGLKVYAQGDWTIGRELSSEEAFLPMVPPLKGRAGISYENRNILGADLSITGAGAREIDRIAKGERPTDAWYRLDFSIHSKIFTFGRCNLQLFGGVDNITDKAYVNFLSTNRGNIICEPGRNFFLRANFSF